MFLFYIVCPLSTSEIAWIDASSVKLGCIGFSKSASTWTGSLAACKETNSKAHLIEIFNDNQSMFLMSDKVQMQVIAHIGIVDIYSPASTRTSLGLYWWIGAELNSETLTWYWEHSKKQVTYWSHIGGNGNGQVTNSSYPYALVRLSNTKAWWNICSSNCFYRSICQI